MRERNTKNLSKFVNYLVLCYNYKIDKFLNMQEVKQNTEDTTQTSKNVVLNQLINLCIEKEASDIHFREDSRTALRTRGKIVFVENVDKLSKKDTEAMINAIIPSEYEKNKLKEEREVDFSYTHDNGVNFRVNIFYQKGKLAGVMRMIAKHVPTFEELGVPEIMKNYLNLREGLILICGTAGSGKSTTIQSMLQHINENYVKHILTIENPIEYVFEDDKSMFTQREVGRDTMTKANALNSAVREDVNVVMVSGIADSETLDHALKLVETGHLVIASMMARDSAQAVDRLVNMYPNDVRKYAADRLADNLTAILAQDLAEKQDQTGLTAIFELMFTNQNIRKVIKGGNFPQIKNTIKASGEENMITMEQYAYGLAEKGIISEDEMNEHAQSEE